MLSPTKKTVHIMKMSLLKYRAGSCKVTEKKRAKETFEKKKESSRRTKGRGEGEQGVRRGRYFELIRPMDAVHH